MAPRTVRTGYCQPRPYGTYRARWHPSQVVTAAPPHVENLSLCPRTVAEVEAVIAGGAWPPERDEAPELFRQWCRPNPEVRGGGMERVELPVAVH